MEENFWNEIKNEEQKQVQEKIRIFISELTRQKRVPCRLALICVQL